MFPDFSQLDKLGEKLTTFIDETSSKLDLIINAQKELNSRIQDSEAAIIELTEKVQTWQTKQ